MFATRMLAIGFLFWGMNAFAQSSAARLDYSGRIFEPGGNPLVGPISVRADIRVTVAGNPCVLYRRIQLEGASDQITADMDGHFSVVFRTGANTIDVGEYEAANLQSILSTSQVTPLTCLDGVTTFVPNSGTERIAEISVSINGGSSWMVVDEQLVSPAYLANDTMAFGGLGLANFVYDNGDGKITRAKVESLLDSPFSTNLNNFLSTGTLAVTDLSLSSFGTLGTSVVSRNYVNDTMAGADATALGSLGPGDSNKIVKWDGTKWVADAIPTVGAAGLSGQIQFNSSGTFGAATGLVWEAASTQLRIGDAAFPETGATVYSNRSVTNSSIDHSAAMFTNRATFNANRNVSSRGLWARIYPVLNGGSNLSGLTTAVEAVATTDSASGSGTIDELTGMTVKLGALDAYPGTIQSATGLHVRSFNQGGSIFSLTGVHIDAPEVDGSPGSLFSEIGLLQSSSTARNAMLGKLSIGVNADTDSLLHVERNLDSPVRITARNPNNGTLARSVVEIAVDTGTIGSLWAASSNYGSTHQRSRLLLASTTGSGVDLVSATDLRFYSGGSATTNERIRVLANGNVGIGQASPGYPLDVTGPLASRGGATNGLIFGDRTNGANLYQWYSDVNRVRLHRNFSTASDILSIDLNGNLALGSTTHDAKLTVTGTSGQTLKIVDGNQGAGKVLTSDASGQASWQTPTGGGGTDVTSTNGAVSSASTVKHTMNYTGTGSGGVANATQSIFSYSGTGGAQLMSGAYGKLVLNSSLPGGYHGAGLFHVVGQSGTATEANAVNGIVELTGGSITHAAAGNFSFVSGTAANAYGVYVGTVNGTNKWSLYTSQTNAPVYIAGSLGVGVLNPTQKMEVSGVVYSNSGGFKFPDGSVQTTAAVAPSAPPVFIVLNSTCPASTTLYTAPGMSSTSPVAIKVPVPRSGTIREVLIRTSTAQPGDGGLTINIRNNDTNVLSTTILANAAAGIYKVTGTTSFLAEELIAISIYNQSPGSASANIVSISFVYE